jgi:phosphatidylinositol alpha-1,6-mannosyltransferase
MTSPVILTPTLTGHDGLSCLSRQFVTALANDAERLDVLSLADTAPTPGPTRGSRAWDPASSWPANVAVTGCGGRRAEFVRRSWMLARRAGPASHVVVLHAHLLTAAWPFARKRVGLVPVLVGVEAWRRLSWPRRRVLAQARRAIAISDHTARQFRLANPDFGSLPIDVCWPATPPLAPADGIAPLGSRPFALIVGRLSAEERYKGHDLLIDLWPRVRRAVPDATLVVAGTGDDESRLEARVTQAGLSNAIHIVGAQTPERLAALYRDCAFLLMPSRHEGFGFVFLEAMSAGRACIGGRGAAEEIIVDGETGFIVDPDHIDDVADKIIALFRQPELGVRMGEAARRRAAEQFSMDRFTRQLSAHLPAC